MVDFAADSILVLLDVTPSGELASSAAGLLGAGRVGTGIGYGMATFILGGMATWAGIVLGSLARRSGAPQAGVRLPIDPDTSKSGDSLDRSEGGPR